MAKSESNQQKLGLDDKEFTTIDGRILNLGEYFVAEDFAIDDGGAAFVKHDALLRVCKNLFTVVERNVKHTQEAKKENGLCAAASVEYVLRPRTDDGQQEETYRWTSLADCHVGNAPQPNGNKYTTAIAETRASGRALRFLLGVEFCTKEEIDNPARTVESDDGPIKPNIVMTIEKKFMGQLGITLEQMRKLLKKSEEEMPTLDSLTVLEGGQLIQKLNRYQEKLVKEARMEEK